MRTNRCTAVGVLTLLALAVAPAGRAAAADPAGGTGPTPGRYRSIDLGTLGGPSSQATAVNERLQVVGGSTTANGESHPFLWQHGQMTDLGLLGGVQGGATAINNRGQVVGSSDTPSGGQHAFLWQDGRLTDLGTLGGPISAAYDINDSGVVVGVSVTADDGWHAFRWANGTMTDLGAFDAHGLNNHGTVVGTQGRAYEGESVFPVRWDRGRLVQLDRTPGRAIDVNDAGLVLGTMETDGEPSHPVTWFRGVRTRLGTLGGDTGAYAVNNRGMIAGASNPTGSDTPHPVLWYGQTMLDLTTRGVPAGAFLTAVNDHGCLAGALDDHAVLLC